MSPAGSSAYMFAQARVRRSDLSSQTAHISLSSIAIPPVAAFGYMRPTHAPMSTLNRICHTRPTPSLASHLTRQILYHPLP